MPTSKFLAVAFTTLLAGTAVAKPQAPAKGPAPFDPDAGSMSITTTSSQGRLGVAVIQISPELRTALGAPADRGVLVDAVKSGSPAAKAGLRVGDVVTDVDGDAATSAIDMLSAMADRKQGDAVKLAVLRDHKRVSLSATLTDDGSATWQRQTRRIGQMGTMDPRFQQWFDASGMPSMDAFSPFSSGREQALEKRIEQLEQRLEKIEKYH
jgi:C-terminal processing protease CtpA/Prc